MSDSYNTATGALKFGTPSVITPMIRTLFTPFLFEEGETISPDEYYFAIIGEETPVEWEGYAEALVETAKEHLKLSITLTDDFADVFRALAQHVGVNIDEWLKKIDFDYSIEMHWVLDLAKLLNDGHNLIGYSIQGSWWSSQPEYLGFGGWSQHYSQHLLRTTSTYTGKELAEDLDVALGTGLDEVVKVLDAHFKSITDSIFDEGIRKEVLKKFNLSS